MEENQARQQGTEETNEMNIQQFLAAARQYLFELAAPQPALATIRVRQER